MTVYYDYLGLICLRIYGEKKEKNYLGQAKDAFSRSLDYVSLVDMSMQIWSGFLTYNLARVYTEYEDPRNADKYFIKAISIRRGWLECSNFNVTVRNALSYEYFIAKISHLDMCGAHGLMSTEKVQNEYNNVEKELNTYSDIDSKLDQLVYIRKLLKARQTGINSDSSEKSGQKNAP